MTPEDHLLVVAFEERIRDLTGYLRWFRASPIMRRALPSLEVEYRQELRSLLRLRSKVRRAQRELLRREVQRTAAIDSGVLTWEQMRRQDLADEIELGMI